ncbi:hypothetical protein HMI54_009384 [Coelomomyces lativittatus]|nr:hypothetical protein HMI54_009384 [Coelomomyces lativittatus]KAJ1502539.1 hypothetical protein HMI55_002862 [Coelomomyces lativittatus]
MDKVKEKVNALRTEADDANRRAEDAEMHLKKSKELLAMKENEVNTLNNKIALLQLDLERAEKRIDQVKVQNQVESDTKNSMDTFSRKCTLLEEKLSSVEINLKTALERYDVTCFSIY